MLKSLTSTELEEEVRGAPFLNQVQRSPEEVEEQDKLKLVPRERVTGVLVATPLNMTVMGPMTVVPAAEKGLKTKATWSLSLLLTP